MWASIYHVMLSWVCHHLFMSHQSLGGLRRTQRFVSHARSEGWYTRIFDSVESQAYPKSSTQYRKCGWWSHTAIKRRGRTRVEHRKWIRTSLYSFWITNNLTAFSASFSAGTIQPCFVPKAKKAKNDAGSLVSRLAVCWRICLPALETE